MYFGGGTVACNTGVVSLLTPLEQANSGLSATHKLISGNTQLLLRNTGSPQLSSQQFLGQFHALTGPITQINTTTGPAALMTVTGALPPGSPGCFPPGPVAGPVPTTTPPAQQDNTLLLLLLLSGGLGGGGGGSNLSQLLPLLLLSGGLGGGAI